MFKTFFRCFLLCFVFLTNFAYAQNLDPQPYKFSWKPTEGAGGYLAEVQDFSGNAVTSQQVPSALTSITFQLVPGSYQLKMTTLNRLLKPEAATDWLPIHVAAAGPPKVGSVSPIVVAPGAAASLDIPVTGLAQDATASLTTPTGATMALPMGQPSDGVLKLTLPTLTERGDYSIVIANPPKLVTTVAGKLSVHYPAPVVDKVDPPRLSQSALAQALHITGKNFSGEAVVVLQGQDGKQVSLVVNQRSETSLTAIVPPNLGADGYQVMVANAADELPVTSGSLAVQAVAEGPKIGVPVVQKGGLMISTSNAGTLTLLGQSVLLAEGAALPVTDLDAGNMTIRMTYADGKTENRTVKVLAGRTTDLVFSETVGIQPPGNGNEATTPGAAGDTRIFGKVSQLGAGFDQYNGASVNGAHVRNIEVQIENQETKKQYQFLSGDGGFFFSGSLPPGTYALSRLFLKVTNGTAEMSVWLSNINGSHFFTIAENKLNNLGWIEWTADKGAQHYRVNKGWDDASAFLDKTDATRSWSEEEQVNTRFRKTTQAE